MVEQKSKKYRIILLNTNFWLDVDNIDSRFHSHQYHQHEHHHHHHHQIQQQQQQQQPQQQQQHQQRIAGSLLKNSTDPHNQWRWFESVLRTAREKKDNVSCFISLFLNKI